jgi:YVTN family beta-propeller protein
MNFKKSIFSLFCAAILVASCSSDNKPTSIQKNYESGFFILNEGNFTKSNANVTFVPDGVIGYENNIFTAENPNLRGDAAQSMLIYKGFVYIAFNGSDKIEVVDRKTFKSVATINQGIASPRYMVGVNDKIYLSNWGDEQIATDDYIAVINPSNNTVTTKISVGEGPEKMVESNGKLYVAQKGGFNTGNTVTVIDTTGDSIAGVPILVGDNPNSIQVQGDNVWVLCGGNKPWGKPEENTAGGIYKISKQAGRVTGTISFDDKSVSPQNLTLTSNNAYYTIGNDVYKLGLSETTLPSKELFKSKAVELYGFAIKENGIFIADAKYYSSVGSFYIHSLGENVGASAPGTLISDEIVVGFLPNGFYFNF